MYRLLAVLAALAATARADMPGLLCASTDTVILVDSSQSITKEQFESIKTYAANFVDKFEIGPDMGQAQFSLVLFNEDTALSWPLNKYPAKSDLTKAIKTLPYMTGITDTGRAFQQAQTLLQGEGHRRGSCRGIVLFTDGRYDHGDNPVPLAQQIRTELQAMVITVAVEGINGFLAPFDKEILIDIAGDPKHFFELKHILKDEM